MEEWCGTAALHSNHQIESQAEDLNDRRQKSWYTVKTWSLGMIAATRRGVKTRPALVTIRHGASITPSSTTSRG